MYMCDIMFMSLEILDVDNNDRMKIIGSGGHKVRGLINETGMFVHCLVWVTV